MDIQTADQAAMALEPLVNVFPNARFISKTIFAIDIIGIGFMTIPVLGGSCAYALSDVFGRKKVLVKIQASKAILFYNSYINATWIVYKLSNTEPIKGLVMLPLLMVFLQYQFSLQL